MKNVDVDFAAAQARFQQFLAANNYPVNIIWVTPEDVLTTGKRLIYIRIPHPSASDENGLKSYDEGVAAGRGLLMSTICTMNSSTYCYIWFPKSAKEVPQGIWPHDASLKLSVKLKSSSPAVRRIRSRLLWILLKRWYRESQPLKHLLFS